MFPVLPKQTMSMHTRDGVRLDADVYYPDADGPFPVLLMRQPYGRAIASTVVYAPPSWYAAHGYIVVIQDVRGRGSSEGDFRLFAHEMDDGVDTVNWAAALPKSTGDVGMYGFSYQGMTQLYAAIGFAKELGIPDISQTPLKAICPAMVGHDLYADWAYEGGAFCLQTGWGWAVQLAAETARREGDKERYRTLYDAARGTPDFDPVSGRSPLLETLAPDSFYHDWLNNPLSDAPYWCEISPHHLMKDHPVDLPMFHIGGWFDTYLRGTLRLYREMEARSQYLQAIAVGPWPHLPWGQYVGDLTMGSYAVSSIDFQQIIWFSHFFSGKNAGFKCLQDRPVQLFLMCSEQEHSVELKNQWWGCVSEPQACLKTYYFRSAGVASSAKGSQLIDAASCPDDCSYPNPKATHQHAYDVCIHDPWRPVPSLGGHATFPAGPKNRATLDERTDILKYTTALLEQDMTILGEITVELFCQTDADSFDLCAVVSDVHPNGSVYGMAQGYRRITHSSTVTFSQTPEKVTLTLQPTAFVIPKGHALRLSISGACYPAYAMNPGTGSSPGQGDLIDAQVITIEIHASEQYPSKLILPVVGTNEPATD